MDYLGQGREGEQAMIDLAVQYRLVTDDTSLVVGREDRFQQHNIDRNNQQRVAKEVTAQPALDHHRCKHPNL